MAGRFSSWLTLTVAGRGDVSKCDSGGRANRGHVLKVFITPQRARADTLSRSAGHETPTATPRKVSHKLFMLFFFFRSRGPSLPPKWQLAFSNVCLIKKTQKRARQKR